MGKDWSSSGGKSASRERNNDAPPAPSPGCMRAVFQCFDFHHFQLCLLHQHRPQPPQTPSFHLPESYLIDDGGLASPKGVEAPRNSLETEANTFIKEEDLNIPMSIRINTKKNSASSRDFSSVCGSSPGTKTPNLVARLMGLDLLPHNPSPTFSYPKPVALTSGKSNLPKKSRRRRNNLSYNDTIAGTRSLPETPRMSSARRSDVDPRFSLQINKENLDKGVEMDLSRYLSMAGRRKDLKLIEENSAPRYRARQIVTEIASRRVGIDITNTIMKRGENEISRDENLITGKPNKLTKFVAKFGEELSPCSPRLRFSEVKNRPKDITTQSREILLDLDSPRPSLSSLIEVDFSRPKLVKISTRPKLATVEEEQKPVLRFKKFNRAEDVGDPGRRDSRQLLLSMRKKQEELSVRSRLAPEANVAVRNCQRTPFSNDLPVKKIVHLHQ